MDVVGSEIGQKMRSAIKAKLTELGCYVDDELPDYVMVMVANKRTRAQMEDDLQLFLGDNTELFVNWLHQVLKKLQEVTVPAPKAEPEKSKEKVKEKKSKDKKDKEKSKTKRLETVKKAKKRDKIKEKLRKKEEKKAHKSKKKSKHHDMIRPNIPPLLMNMEKVSEPSITDVFAGQILKNHGIVMDASNEEKPEEKPVIKDAKRSSLIRPIIDPATITQPDNVEVTEENNPAAPREEQIKEMTEIEAKIQGLKQKLVEQLDSMSDDEDFLNIRTEAEELMNDFAEDVFQEISSQAPPVCTPPLTLNKTPSPPPAPIISNTNDLTQDSPIESPPNKEPAIEPPKATTPPKLPEPEILPQIELKLPKRPVRERLGAREEKKFLEDSSAKEKDASAKEKKRTKSPERFTPDKEPDFWGKYKSSAKSRLGDPPEPTRKSPVTTKRSSFSEDSEDSGRESKRERRAGAGGGNVSGVSCVSVVRVRPRPRAPASTLLLRAVADAHKSLLNIPPKPEVEHHNVKRALVHPMRRCVDAQNILIQVPTDRQTDEHENSRTKSDIAREEYIPAPLSKKFTNTDYVPSRRPERTTSRRDDTLVIETINIHNTTVDKDKNTQFIVTMDGFNPNAFLAKKLKTEGILDEEDTTVENKEKEKHTTLKTPKTVLKTDEEIKVPKNKETEKNVEEKKVKQMTVTKQKIDEEQSLKTAEKNEESPPKKRLSDTSDDSDTQVILKQVDEEKNEKQTLSEPNKEVANEESSSAKKRKASPIVFNVKKEKEDVDQKRQRTESASSDNHVIVTTAAANAHKYDAVPSRLPDVPLQTPMSQGEKKLVWCRSFPLCRYGAACAFQHPRCKFAAACTRRNCVYSHSGLAPPIVAAPPTVASHVVPAANYKTISTVSSALPSICKYYPNCVNPTCHFYHPKPCRYGKACANKLECNFYHHNDLATKWRFPV